MPLDQLVTLVADAVVGVGVVFKQGVGVPR